MNRASDASNMGFLSHFVNAASEHIATAIFEASCRATMGLKMGFLFYMLVLQSLWTPLECFHICNSPRVRSLALCGDMNDEERTKSASVLCIGDALFDCIANDDARGLSVEEMLGKGSWRAFPGGAPANVATACRKLGTSSAFVGCLGADEDGDELETLLHDTGVDVTLLQRATDGSPTRRVMVTRSLEGDREFGGFYGGRSADEFADCQLDYRLIFPENDGIQGMATTLIAEADWFVCSTLSLAFEKSADTIHKLVNRGLESGSRLCVDINWRPVFWPLSAEDEAREEIFSFAQRAHIVKLTDEEAEWLLGIPPAEALSDPSKIHEKFPNALGVLVTAGEKGAAYSLLGACGRVEPFAVDVQETTGAGDAFTAGILHGLLSLETDLDSFEARVSPDERKKRIDPLVRFAAATGALTCTKEGAIAAQPTFADVETFLTHGEKVSV